MIALKRKAKPLSAAQTAKLLHWLKVLHAEECAAHCRIVEGTPVHLGRCKQIQRAIDAAEGK